MRAGRPKPQLTISDMERAQLSVIARSRSMPAALVLRAKIVLACECEANNQAVAANLISALILSASGAAASSQGLYDEVRSGRPRTVKDGAVVTLISKTLASKPEAATHWGVRSMADETGLSKRPAHRLFQLFALQPRRTRSFKISSDPFFVEKLRRIVGLYLDPPDRHSFSASMKRAKSRRWNAPNRCCPSGSAILRVSPMMTNPTAPPPCGALNRLDGSVLAQCKPRHRNG